MHHLQTEGFPRKREPFSVRRSSPVKPHSEGFQIGDQLVDLLIG